MEAPPFASSTKTLPFAQPPLPPFYSFPILASISDVPQTSPSVPPPPQIPVPPLLLPPLSLICVLVNH
ncbi:hypothetical protein FF1_007279 [Malus domestica]